MRTEVNINTKMITWAIARAGYELPEFIDKVPMTLDWIENKKKPTIKQLEKFSKKVNLSFGYFFLEEPPKESMPIPFFRTNYTQKDIININVYDTVLLVQQRQNWLRDYLIDNENKPLHFVGKYSGNTNYLDIVTDIRKALHLDLEWASVFKSWEDALESLTEVIEEIGVVVVFNSMVGNNTHRPIKVDDCRGFVLVDEFAPFMFVNTADGKAAQLFTIAHELAHIWTGNSAGFDFRQLQPANNPIELLCNKVAAELLVPQESFNRVWQENPDIKYIAKYFKVSTIVAARRAFDLSKITKESFFQFYNDYIELIKTQKAKKSNGGDFYSSAKKRLSLSFAYYINQAVKADKLLYSDAYKLTSMNGNTYQTFFNKNFAL